MAPQPGTGKLAKIVIGAARPEYRACVADDHHISLPVLGQLETGTRLGPGKRKLDARQPTDYVNHVLRRYRRRPNPHPDESPSAP